MLLVVTAAASCFDWSVRVRQHPAREHLEALLVLHKALLSSLQFAHWPYARRIGHVEESWPSRRNMFSQYNMMLARLRRCARADREKAYPDIWVPCACMGLSSLYSERTDGCVQARFPAALCSHVGGYGLLAGAWRHAHG
jgi:hypothetical protein